VTPYVIKPTVPKAVSFEQYTKENLKCRKLNAEITDFESVKLYVKIMESLKHRD